MAAPAAPSPLRPVRLKRPVGIQTFGAIRENGHDPVDKTGGCLKLVHFDVVNFFG